MFDFKPQKRKKTSRTLNKYPRYKFKNGQDFCKETIIKVGYFKNNWSDDNYAYINSLRNICESFIGKSVDELENYVRNNCRNKHKHIALKEIRDIIDISYCNDNGILKHRKLSPLQLSSPGFLTKVLEKYS